MLERIIKLLSIFTFCLFAQHTYANNEIVGSCSQIADPYEELNRKIFTINKTFDQTILRPSVLLYINTVPEWPRYRVNSFFSNLASPLTFINNVLQGDFDAAGKTFGRFLFNSTVGIGGMLDWAKMCGVEDKPQVFEDTLMKFNVPYGQYLILPFLGPSTTRGTTGKIVDMFTDPVNLTLITHKNNVALKYFLAKKFNQRAQYEEDIDLSKQNLLDEYSFIRSSYIQYLAAQNQFCKNQENIDYESYN
ncbi:MAG: VacJ family lipoprotein [Rickettsiales bacterium]|nr:VacJ family lipoprotein [Rickettsiales bacterium]